jgi:hypothetical protein
MKKFRFLIGIVAMFCATSCLIGDGKPGSSSETYTGELTVVDTDTKEQSYFDSNASVSIWIPNITEPKFDFIFNGIKFDDLMPVRLNMEVLGIPFNTTISEDQTTINYVFEASNVIPKAGGVNYEKYTIGEIKGCVGKEVEITFTMPSKNKTVYFKTKYTTTE